MPWATHACKMPKASGSLLQTMAVGGARQRVAP